MITSAVLKLGSKDRVLVRLTTRMFQKILSDSSTYEDVLLPK